MRKEVELMRPLHDRAVQCLICEHFCTLKPGEWGKCGVRFNEENREYLVVYGQAIAANIDPIEKKPLFHFLPGSQALSIGTYGCNLCCLWCQNWNISQVHPTDWQNADLGERLEPAELVEIASRRHIASIAYTYNEPTVYFEYTYDTAQIAREQGIKNVYVSNGYMSPQVLEKITPYLDAANIDLKGFTEEFYRKYTGARLEPVKRNIATLAHTPEVWIEVTTLLIPDLNDSNPELEAMAAWLAEVDPEMPWHVTAFHPDYKLQDRPPTSTAALERAYQIGKAAGLKYVYVGNVLAADRENTRCPHCNALLVQRAGYRIKTSWQTPGICSTCQTPLAGVWK